MTSDREIALESSAWPFAEARKLLARTGGATPAKGYVLLETGYGPSGLPHIGTFGEVARTSMVSPLPFDFEIFRPASSRNSS